MGRGALFMSKEQYLEQMQALLGFRPYRGTLNILVNEEDREKIDWLKNGNAILIKGFIEGEREFGDVLAYKAELDETRCAIVLPKLSTHTEQLEIISDKKLREKLALADGDRITIKIIDA